VEPTGARRAAGPRAGLARTQPAAVSLIVGLGPGPAGPGAKRRARARITSPGRGGAAQVWAVRVRGAARVRAGQQDRTEKAMYCSGPAWVGEGQCRESNGWGRGVNARRVDRAERTRAAQDRSGQQCTVRIKRFTPPGSDAAMQCHAARDFRSNLNHVRLHSCTFTRFSGCARPPTTALPRPSGPQLRQ
jgi:hypothetical protein